MYICDLLFSFFFFRLYTAAALICPKWFAIFFFFSSENTNFRRSVFVAPLWEENVPQIIKIERWERVGGKRWKKNRRQKSVARKSHPFIFCSLVSRECKKVIPVLVIITEYSKPLTGHIYFLSFASKYVSLFFFFGFMHVPMKKWKTIEFSDFCSFYAVSTFFFFFES